MTTEMTREALECLVWDLYKDVHGIRPRFLNISGMTTSDLEGLSNDLIEELGEKIEEDKRREENAINVFEMRVAETLKFGARDRATALRWILTADNANGDYQFLCYLNGLPYNYFKSETLENE